MFDYTIVGGGIVGLSTAYHICLRRPRARILLLEKEKSWASHQTGHNSGVIHSGIYYKPGSLKAEYARQGNLAMVEFCREHGIDYEICGKVIVATHEQELPRLEELYRRGLANGLDVALIGREELREIEPHVNGIKAIRVPSTGIVDYKQVCRTFVSILQERGAELKLQTRVRAIRENEGEAVLETDNGTFHTRFVVNCAGLHSDRVARAGGMRTGVKIVPFRGEYFELKPESRHLVKNLIYPVPDPAFPFLGVHFTRMIGGGVEAGPNAVLCLKREGYRKTDFSLRDAADVLTYPGFWKLAAKYWKAGMEEMIRSWSKAAFVKSLRRLIPDIGEEDLTPAPAGVRAQALQPDGRLVDDFYLISGRSSLHVGNAPSPAATASLRIGEAIVDRLGEA